jgi:hypothetical protein
MLWKLDGYLAIPHELLHVLAYRLIGKRYAYRFGDHTVRALDPRTFGQRMFCLLFPLLINGIAVLLLLGAWLASYLWAGYPTNPFVYFRIAPVWHRALFFGWVFLLTYAATATFDVLLAVRLLLEKLRQQPPNNPHQD